MRRGLTIICATAIFLFAATSNCAAQTTIRGKLQKTVEPGGWLISNETSKYLLLNGSKFEKYSWFKESTEVQAEGTRKPDTVTMYMEGMPFQASSINPVAQGATTVRDDSKKPMTRVLVSGDAVVQALPDTAVLTISVVTQAKRAIDAQQENAAKSDAVAKALKSSVGSAAEIKTSGYSLQPQRIYKEGQPPTITGYEARNTVTVTLSDLTKVGATVDAAGQAGANDVSSISFSLRQDRPARDQALKEATREAVSKAQVIAQALGGRVVRIVEVEEQGFQRPQPIYQSESLMRNAASPTPIQVGSLDINSRVQLIAEVETSIG